MDPLVAAETMRAVVACQVLKLVLSSAPDRGDYLKAIYGPQYNNHANVN